MIPTKEFVNNALTIKCRFENGALVLDWFGRSNEREPAQFITPILEEALALAGDGEIVMDFRALEYMNSSTITPLLRLLQQARSLPCKIKLVYRKALRWQELSFSALQIFRTADGKIRIEGI
jgi:hypothetical protein